MNKDTNKELNRYLSARNKHKKHWLNPFRFFKKHDEADISPEKITEMLKSKEIHQDETVDTIKKTHPSFQKIEDKTKKQKIKLLKFFSTKNINKDDKIANNSKIKNLNDYESQKENVKEQSVNDKTRSNKMKEKVNEINRDALEIWKIGREMLRYLPQDKKDKITDNQDYINFKKKIETYIETQNA